MSTCPHRLAGRERGASLFVALIFLVVMAMLGVTLANVTNMEERMAGNTRDRDLALQAAEAALRAAELKLAGAVFRDGPFPAFDAERGNDAAFWEGCFKNKSEPCGTLHVPDQALPTSGTGAIAQPPQYVIETKPLAGTTEVFRVTARAVGGSPDTIVVLQAEFGYTPP
jgi:type IV pilus assembly protein PilX